MTPVSDLIAELLRMATQGSARIDSGAESFSPPGAPRMIGDAAPMTPTPQMSGGFSDALAAFLGNQPAAEANPNIVHPGAQVQDGPLGENAHLGWETAPEVQYPQKPVVRPANFAASQPLLLHPFPAPPFRRGMQHVPIVSPYGTVNPQPSALAAALHRLGLHSF